MSAEQYEGKRETEPQSKLQCEMARTQEVADRLLKALEELAMRSHGPEPEAIKSSEDIHGGENYTEVSLRLSATIERCEATLSGITETL